MKHLLFRIGGILNGVLLVLMVLGYFGVLENTFLGPRYDSLMRGYGSAKTPQEAADLFKKALNERDFRIAAKYCTARYQEQLHRGAKGSREMATKMDDLIFQMQERGYNTDTSKVLFMMLDPFPNDVTITVSKESGDEAWATFAFANSPVFKGESKYEDWQLDARMFNVYWKGPVRNPVRMLKEKDVWRLDFNVEPLLQQCVDRLNEKYKDYYNACNVLTLEVKNEPTTKENVRGRLKALFEEAAR